MVERMRRWLRFDAAPVVGIQFRDDRAYLAVVRAPNRVVGLGVAAMPPGSVTAGHVQEPEAAAALVDRALSSIHWRYPPSIRVAVPPASWNGAVQAGLVTTTVHDHGSGAAVAVGTLAVTESVLASTLEAVQSVAGRPEWVRSDGDPSKSIRRCSPALPGRSCSPRPSGPRSVRIAVTRRSTFSTCRRRAVESAQSGADHVGRIGRRPSGGRRHDVAHRVGSRRRRHRACDSDGDGDGDSRPPRRRPRRAAQHDDLGGHERR